MNGDKLFMVRVQPYLNCRLGKIIIDLGERQTMTRAHIALPHQIRENNVVRASAPTTTTRHKIFIMPTLHSTNAQRTIEGDTGNILQAIHRFKKH
jgi:hypothetical protein